METTLTLDPEAGVEEFVRLTEVVAGSGVDVRTVRRRLNAAGIPVFCDPWDLRRRMVRRDDIARLFQAARPIEARPVAAKAA